MTEQKFHINKAGDVKECKATVRGCRFGGDVDHFTDHTEAIKESEQRSKEDAPDEFGTVTRKVVEVKEDKPVIVSEEFKKTITEMASQKGMYSEHFQETGEIFEKEFEKRLSFNPWDHELSREELQDVQNVNRELFSALVTNGGDMPVKATGPMSEQLNEAVRILPDKVKGLTETVNLDTKHLHGATRKRVGQYNGHAEIKSAIPDYEYLGEEFSEVSPEGTLVPKYNFNESDLGERFYGASMTLNEGGGPKYKKVWLGQKPKNNGYKKIADSAEVFVDGKVITVDEPLYEIQLKRVTTVPQILMSKGVAGEEAKSTLLHEYCHAVQHKVRPQFAEGEMFRKTAGDKSLGTSYGVTVHEGFPNEYMGADSRLELLPMATEGLFHPTAGNGFFYGSDRGTNAHEVRRWVTGFWLSQGNYSPRIRKT